MIRNEANFLLCFSIGWKNQNSKKNLRNINILLVSQEMVLKVYNIEGMNRRNSIYIK